MACTTYFIGHRSSDKMFDLYTDDTTDYGGHQGSKEGAHYSSHNPSFKGSYYSSLKGTHQATDYGTHYPSFEGSVETTYFTTKLESLDTSFNFALRSGEKRTDDSDFNSSHLSTVKSEEKTTIYSDRYSERHLNKFTNIDIAEFNNRMPYECEIVNLAVNTSKQYIHNATEAIWLEENRNGTAYAGVDNFAKVPHFTSVRKGYRQTVNVGNRTSIEGQFNNSL